MKELLARLVTEWGPSGREAEIAKAIGEAVRPHVDTVQQDTLGNVIAMRHPRGTAAGGQRLLLTAHLDSATGIVTEITGEGRLQFGTVGEISVTELVHRRVRFRSGVTAVVGAQRVDKELKASDCWLDLGVDSADAARRLVAEGEMFVLEGGLTELGDLWCGPHLDNRAGCAVVLEVARRLGDSPHQIRFAFTVQGQLASPRGARTIAFAAPADLAVAVDAIPAEPAKGSAARSGEGPVLKVREGRWILRPEARRSVTAAAATAGVRWQLEARAVGSSEASALESAGAGTPAAAIALPIRYMGTACEMVHPADLEAATRWLTALLIAPLPN